MDKYQFIELVCFGLLTGTKDESVADVIERWNKDDSKPTAILYNFYVMATADEWAKYGPMVMEALAHYDWLPAWEREIAATPAPIIDQRLAPIVALFSLSI